MKGASHRIIPLAYGAKADDPDNEEWHNEDALEARVGDNPTVES